MTTSLSRIPSLSASQARRVSLSAQGFGRVPDLSRSVESGQGALPGTRALNTMLTRMQTLQIDSVNVFARSHYMPLLARLGPYDVNALDKLLFSPRPAYVESWAHVAAFIPASDWGLFAFRHSDLRAKYGEGDDWFDAHHDVIDWVRSELAERGPLRPAEIDHDAKRTHRGAWWDWNVVKEALERLFMFGEVAIAGRRGFERRYALAEHVVPEAARRDVPREEAIVELIERAARAYGVATAADLADYWRLRDRSTVMAAIGRLTEEGVVQPVTVQGWESTRGPLPAWRHRDAVVPRRIEGTALLTPFDPVVWFRERALRLFDLDYRIEIYTPAAKRRFGYYSLPVLVDDEIVARVDLKAERATETLLVQSAWWEPRLASSTDLPGVAQRIASVLRTAAQWRQLSRVSVGRWGDAADHIATALGGRTARHERML